MFGAVLKVIAKVKVDLIKDVDVFLVVGHSIQHAQFLVGVERTGMAWKRQPLQHATSESRIALILERNKQKYINVVLYE